MNLAENYGKQGRPDRAGALFQEALEARRTFGPTHPTAGIHQKAAPNDWRRYCSKAMLCATAVQRPGR